MIDNILKRDGSKQKFESFKIEDAIKKAFKSVNIQYDISIFFNVLFEIKQKRLVAVEDIQDIIEKELFKARYFDVMKSFIYIDICIKYKGNKYYKLQVIPHI